MLSTYKTCCTTCESFAQIIWCWWPRDAFWPRASQSGSHDDCRTISQIRPFLSIFNERYLYWYEPRSEGDVFFRTKSKFKNHIYDQKWPKNRKKLIFGNFKEYAWKLILPKLWPYFDLLLGWNNDYLSEQLLVWYTTFEPCRSWRASLWVVPLRTSMYESL